MPNFLSDPPPSFYLVLFLIVVVTGAIALRYQDRRSTACFAAALALLVVLWAIDFGFESPREQAVRRVKDIERSMNDRRPEALSSHVTETFVYGGIKKANLKDSQLWGVLKQYDARVVTWDFDRDDAEEPDDRTISLGFMAKGEPRSGGEPLIVYVRATFVRDPDGQYRMKGIKALDPVGRKAEVHIPF